MADSRTKNAMRNLVWGILDKIVVLLLPFVTRTMIIYLLGVIYLGVGTLFSSILSFLSLAELGIGSALTYSMYKPIAQNDTKLVCALLNYYKHLYRRIGIVMFAVGTALIPLLPILTNGDAPSNINIYILYYIYLLNSVFSYFFAGYRSSIFVANQRIDISTKFNTVFTATVRILQIYALAKFKNYYVYAAVPILGTIATNISTAVLTRKIYPDIRPIGEASSEIKYGIKKRISGLIGTRLNSIVVHSADTIVISTFLGLTVTAQYGNYYTIFNAVCGFVSVVFSALTASIGNKIVKDSKEENLKFYYRLTFVNAWIVCICCSCFLCLFEPFMAFWVGEDLAFGMIFAIVMVIYFFVYQIQKTILTFKDAAGIWYADRLRPYVSMCVNLLSNLLLVQIIGIYGIVISSILAFLISMPWANHVLMIKLFETSSIKSLLMIGKYFVICVLGATLSYMCCLINVNGLIGIFVRLVIAIIVSNIVFILCCYKTKEWNYWKSKIMSRFIKKI